MAGRVRRRGSSWSAAAVVIVLACGAAACDEAASPAESVTPSTTTSASPATEPTASTEPAGSDEVVVVAVGDIACQPLSSGFDGNDASRCQHRGTARLARGADAVLGLGDLQYEHGQLWAYHAAYEPTWGRFADITFPAPGNHEHETSGAEGYFTYWASKGRPTGRRAGGAYAFDLGAWHVISLDSSCPPSCGEGSSQGHFLERDLARTTDRCILAFWHHPYFNSGSVHGEEMLASVRGFWDDLYAAGADVVLNGHEHNYQRYAEQTPSGRATPRGIRQFVVGTGGKQLYGMLDRKDANYEAGDATHFGVLRLFLRERSYSWEFVAVGGAVLDRGGPTSCD